MRILLTNDDGIYAPGIAALKRVLDKMGDVTVVAPDGERSAAGHSITLDRPLRVREVYMAEALLGYAVDGSPADCVKVGVKEVLKSAPDLVVSGINLGSNAGINVLYSGTVAAGLEGAILGITSVAVSLAEVFGSPDKTVQARGPRKPDFAGAAVVAFGVLTQIIANNPPKGSLFNINLPARPAAEIPGVRIAPQSVVSYEEAFDMRTDPRGGRYFWMTGELDHGQLNPESDTALVAEGYVTVTPLRYDLTDARMLAVAKAWNITLKL